MKVPTPGKFCIFVGDLQPHCTEYDLQQLCGQYGTLVNVLIKRNAATPYAFVTFTSTESAESAIHCLHGYQFMGRTLKANWATRPPRPTPPPGAAVNSLYVRYSSLHTGHVVEETDIRRIFGRYGTIEEICMKENSFDPVSSRHSGYAFVHFSSFQDGVQAAFQAVTHLDNKVVEGILFNCELSRNLLKQFNREKALREQHRGPGDYSAPAYDFDEARGGYGGAAYPPPPRGASALDPPGGYPPPRPSYAPRPAYPHASPHSYGPPPSAYGPPQAPPAYRAPASSQLDNLYAPRYPSSAPPPPPQHQYQPNSAPYPGYHRTSPGGSPSMNPRPSYTAYPPDPYGYYDTQPPVQQASPAYRPRGEDSASAYSFGAPSSQPPYPNALHSTSSYPPYPRPFESFDPLPEFRSTSRDLGRPEAPGAAASVALNADSFTTLESSSLPADFEERSAAAGVAAEGGYDISAPSFDAPSKDKPGDFPSDALADRLGSLQLH